MLIGSGMAALQQIRVELGNLPTNLKPRCTILWINYYQQIIHHPDLTHNNPFKSFIGGTHRPRLALVSWPDRKESNPTLMCGSFCSYFEIYKSCVFLSPNNFFVLFLFYNYCFFPLCFIFVPFLSQADVNCCQNCGTGANIWLIKMEPELSFLIIFLSIIKIMFHRVK